ncbi:hypothetical protein VNO78_27079 [Psophocarpus tetragonolobus]|uniref:Uncharacterized protein n=1 Tax=Psophocarpus tetragonolobus TaxID=3891 RepID=A0AAN9XBN5_PSOTE
MQKPLENDTRRLGEWSGGLLDKFFKTILKEVLELKNMESDHMEAKDVKVSMQTRSEVLSNTVVEFQGGHNLGQGGLQRQPSMTKTNCLCSPTTHAGSFRCRLHRAPNLQRTKSMESESLRDQASTVHASIIDASKDSVH